jgi:hypothetical protein
LVNTQLHLQQFERSLYQADNLDEAWALIVAGARDFGLFGVQFCLGGRLFDSMPNTDMARYWQVRAPLPHGQSLSVSYDPARDTSAVVIASFPKVVERFLTSRASSTTEELAAPKAASAPL